jgi:hypothetical protein
VGCRTNRTISNERCERAFDEVRTIFASDQALDRLAYCLRRFGFSRLIAGRRGDLDLDTRDTLTDRIPALRNDGRTELPDPTRAVLRRSGPAEGHEAHGG